MTSLKDLQDSFQKALLDGDLTILSQIPDSPKEQNDKLLGVYQFAYRARLMEFLENDYPQLHGYLGDEQFAELSMAFIDKYPSRHPNARWYGDQLPAFMGDAPPYKQKKQLPELAQLEHALNNIFDERDEPALTLTQMAQIPPEQWTSLVFTPHKATKRLDFETNVINLWNALVLEETPPEAQAASEILHILVFRFESQSSFRSMSYEEAMMWDKMAAGVPFGVLCELVAAYGGDDEAAMRAATHLQSWVSAGLILDNFNSDKT